MRVYSQEERGFNEIRNAAVAIALMGNGQQHLGILFQTDLKDEIKLADLAWHHDLRERNPKPHYLWVDPPIHTVRALQVAVRCRQVLKANRAGMPYGFSAPSDCFDDETGRWLLGDTGVGLTCATFVLAVFRYAGIDLAVLQDWPAEREGDAEWVKSICEALLQDGVSEEHVQRLQKNGGVRYRPEDVAGCAAAGTLPCSFDPATELATRILQKLLDQNKLLQP